jgi:polysaccharide biosynthesis/export protein
MMRMNNESQAGRLTQTVLGICLVLASATLSAQQASLAKDHDPITPPVTENVSAPVVTDDAFVIGAGDVLAINVWKEPEISHAVPVRSDGKVSLPLVGELQASGQTPRQLQVTLKEKLQAFISDPDVTVIVQEVRSQRFNILGQVVKPGSYLLTNTTTVLDALALAGGFRDFAKKKSIYVLRAKTDGSQTRIPFNYNDVIKGSKPAQNIRLEPRDTLVIP